MSPAAGFIISYSQIPVYYQWLNRITPTTWILYALTTSQVRAPKPSSPRARKLGFRTLNFCLSVSLFCRHLQASP